MTTNTANFNNFANNITPPQDSGYGDLADDGVETDYNLDMVLNPASTSYTPVEMDLMTNPMSEDFSLV